MPVAGGAAGLPSLEGLDATVFLSVGQWQPLLEKEVVTFASVFNKERTSLQPKGPFLCTYAQGVTHSHLYTHENTSHKERD